VEVRGYQAEVIDAGQSTFHARNDDEGKGTLFALKG
jgi:hypothetical protein